MPELVRARIETIAVDDLLRLPSGRLVRCTGGTWYGDELVLHHDSGSLVAMRRGERWPVERRQHAPGDRGAGNAAPAPQTLPVVVPPPPAPNVSGGTGDPQRSAAPAGGGARAGTSPVSNGRVTVLASVLGGFRWPGDQPRAGTRRARALEQVARFALESLSVVE